MALKQIKEIKKEVRTYDEAEEAAKELIVAAADQAKEKALEYAEFAKRKIDAGSEIAKQKLSEGRPLTHLLFHYWITDLLVCANLGAIIAKKELIKGGKVIRKKVKHLLANKDKAVQYPLVNETVANSSQVISSNGDDSDSDDVGNEENSAVCNIS